MQALIAAVALLFSAALLAGEAPLPAATQSVFVGSGSCASSTCHGAVTPSTRADILHNEFATWQQQDPHAQAYAALESPAARRMAQKLALPQAASETAQCLACHSSSPPDEMRAASFKAGEGVGCESCHGPAGQWLDTHAATGASHANSLTRGMYPTDQAAAEARLCVSCHVGDNSHDADHALMAAGHPRLAFDLATFTALRSYHQQFDADWQARKGSYQPLQRWALGQIEAARQMLLRLADPASQQGLFPELSAYDCHACHRAAMPQQGPQNSGRLRLNDSHLRMALVAARSLAPAQYPALADSYHAWLAASRQSRAQLAASADALAAQLDTLNSALAAVVVDAAAADTLLQLLCAPEAPYSDYGDAEQAYMAIASVIDWQQQQGRHSAARARALAALRAQLADENHYSPQAFASSLAALRQP